MEMTMLKIVPTGSVLAAIASVCLGVSAIAAEPAIQFFPHAGSPKPFSSAVRVGDIVYVSGVIGAAADGSLPNEFTTQTANAMDALRAELKLAGASLDDVFKCNVALTDMNNWADFNTVYAKYFKLDRLPVRMAVGVTSLGGAAVEIQCEAFIGKR